LTSGEGAAVETAEALEGVARELLGRGVPAVVAMTAPVTDRYATTFAAAAYQQLATREDPVPLAAVSDARRAVEATRRALPEGDPWGATAEWATPVLMQTGPPLALYRRSDGVEQLEAPAAPVFDPAMVVRRVGEFVGRRAELRNLLGALRSNRAGVVIHGIGGVGKSTAQGRLADAVSYQVRALAIRAELNSRDTAVDVRLLGQQRAALGDQEFERILRTLVEDEVLTAIMQGTNVK
jgi:hypothetical protein